ncbi:DedA family protein [Desulfuromonas acetoxidans]|uniref:DedA family protein n=1 Tax=Desulfuromonas acetoxidans TaxID=891 RepID=UPI0002FAE21C|nr:DedA family protein [Desulfuromonas acetoxidans]MBF0645176.1 DedA family protein [Desulfuromonas acetoxidans]NVD23080.1 DedA family protein [Desulfuromonas acetoxidans]NVE15679.1 DedA family protein [Desulfuromonas acetoxidans]
MEHLLTSVTATPWYYLLITVIATAEGIALVGLAVPGSVLCVSIGAIAAAGHANFMASCLCAAAGAFVGDLISYLLGGRLGPRLVHSFFPQRSRPLLKRAQIFFAAHGGKSLFLARFFGPLRGLVPFVAGSVRFPIRNLIGYSVVAALLWGLSYPGLGYLGIKSWQQLPERLSVEVLLCLGAVVVVALLVWRHQRNKNR